MDNLPLKKHELAQALRRLQADPVFQWVLAEQERVASFMMMQYLVPSNFADAFIREQHFGRVAKIGEVRQWLGTTIERLEREAREESE